MSRICIVGLGNPGPKYKGTRHNIGFDWVDALAASTLFSSQKLKVAEKFQSYWTMGTLVGGTLNETEIHFLLPQTYMNESGKAVAEWKQKYQGDSKIIVAYDDMDIPIGRLRYREKGSDGGHRGMRSLIEHLGTDEIPRLRIGISRPVDESIDHVLTKFTPDERTILNRLLKDVEWQFRALLGDNAEKIMNQLNSKNYAEITNGA
jgi:PTH1 family peptidyl-tRNA hydrolase